MRIQTVSPITYPGWDEMVVSSPGYSFFHSSPWARVLSESYGFTPLYFTIIKNGKLHALLALMEVKSIITGKRGVSLPFTDYCEPILQDNLSCQELLDDIMKSGRQRGWKYFELRGGGRLLSDRQVSMSYLLHTLDLAKEAAEIFRTFRKGTKSAIKKAEKDSIEITISNSEESIINFYELNCITRKSHGLPPQPQRFFKAIYRHILERGLGMVILASYGGEHIAGGVFFHFGEKAIYKYGASKREYQDLRATNLIVWRAINYYLDKGCRSFCFGRTETENQGLRIFKNGWGTTEQILNYYKYDLRAGRFVMSEKAVSGFQNVILGKMPIPLLKILGTIGYKHMG